MNTLWAGAKAPTLGDIEAIADAAYGTIPDELRKRVDSVVIRVAEFPEREVLADLGLDSEFDLLGLYQGVSIDQKSVAETPSNVDMIFLYRQPLLAFWCETDETLDGLIRHVLIHEIGHHFGYSDADMEAIEAES